MMVFSKVIKSCLLLLLSSVFAPVYSAQLRRRAEIDEVLLGEQTLELPPPPFVSVILTESPTSPPPSSSSDLGPPTEPQTTPPSSTPLPPDEFYRCWEFSGIIDDFQPSSWEDTDGNIVYNLSFIPSISDDLAQNYMVATMNTCNNTVWGTELHDPLYGITEGNNVTVLVRHVVSPFGGRFWHFEIEDLYNPTCRVYTFPDRMNDMGSPYHINEVFGPANGYEVVCPDRPICNGSPPAPPQTPPPTPTPPPTVLHYGCWEFGGNIDQLKPSDWFDTEGNIVFHLSFNHTATDIYANMNTRSNKTGVWGTPDNVSLGFNEGDNVTVLVRHNQWGFWQYQIKNLDCSTFLLFSFPDRMMENPLLPYFMQGVVGAAEGHQVVCPPGPICHDHHSG